MAFFFGISPGQTLAGQSIRIEVPADGERVYMHGKWLDLGHDHGVVVCIGSPKLVKPGGASLLSGEFPAWVIRGKGKKPLSAMMFNITQFLGGYLEFTGHDGRVHRIDVQAPHAHSGPEAGNATTGVSAGEAGGGGIRGSAQDQKA